MNSRMLVAIPYACTRVPLGLLDGAVLRRLSAQSGVRVAFECALGAFDVWAGQVLHDQRISLRGCQRVGSAARRADPGVVTTHPGPSRHRPIAPKGYATTRPFHLPDARRSSGRRERPRPHRTDPIHPTIESRVP